MGARPIGKVTASEADTVAAETGCCGERGAAKAGSGESGRAGMGLSGRAGALLVSGGAGVGEAKSRRAKAGFGRRGALGALEPGSGEPGRGDGDGVGWV